MNHFFRILSLLFAILAAAGAAAEDVKLRHGGLTLNANLELAAGKTLKDGVILMTHGTLAHGRMEIMDSLQGLLKEKGYNSLSISLSLGLDDRHGMYECATPHGHMHTDALDEIGAWIGWLKLQGATKVVLLGHSRGGNQVASFAAERDDPAIRSVVLVAPLTWNQAYGASSYEKRFSTPLQPVLDKAQALLTKGRGRDWLEHVNFVYCPDTKATAAAFVSYHGPDSRLDAPTVVAKTGKPVLVVAALDDPQTPGLIENVQPMADGKKVKLVVLEGADHFFRDLYAEEAVDAIVGFVEGN
jgi:pimeloyl-ACP methyl ester carboxylesterase